jgi:hypothetical protein
VAAKLPAVVGLKETATVQELPAASVPAHEVAPLKFVVLPEKVGLLVKTSVAVPVFLNVTFCDAEVALTAVDAKVTLEGETLTVTLGAAAPVPLSVTDCPEVPALSANRTSADNGPSRLGLNVTVTMHEALTASVAPQVLI